MPEEVSFQKALILTILLLYNNITKKNKQTNKILEFYVFLHYKLRTLSLNNFLLPHYYQNFINLILNYVHLKP